MTGRREADETARILRARAAALARPREDLASEAARLHILEFRLAQERYAFEADAVLDVQPLRELTPLPGTPDFVAGLVNLRGHLVTVIDLKHFLHLPMQGITDLHGIILLKSPDFRIGVLADTVVGVHALGEHAIQALPRADAQGLQAEYIRGVTADRIAILDAAAILADPRLVIDQDVEI